MNYKGNPIRYTEEEMNELALSDIIEKLDDDFSGHYSDLHGEVFNTDYFIVGAYKAERALLEYGVFNAIDTVTTYMKKYFGEIDVNTITNPEKLINMLYYIAGENVISEVSEKSKTFRDNYNEIADEETNEQIIKEIREP